MKKIYLYSDFRELYNAFYTYYCACLKILFCCLKLYNFGFLFVSKTTMT